MTASVRDAILSTLTTLGGQVTGLSVFRSRDAALARGETPALVIEPEEETVEFQNAMCAIRMLVVGCTFFGRGDVPDNVVDGYLTAFHLKVMADPTLGGLAARVIEQGTRWDFEVADRTAVGAQVRYQIKYQTLAADLSKAA